MPTTRRKTLFVLVPGGFALGIGSLAVALVHGLSRPVIGGVVGGLLAGAALVVLVGSNWRRLESASARAVSRRAWERTRGPAVGLGLLGAGAVSALGGALGVHAHGAHDVALSAAGALFVVASAVIAVMALRHPELWDS